MFCMLAHYIKMYVHETDTVKQYIFSQIANSCFVKLSYCTIVSILGEADCKGPKTVQVYEWVERR